MADNSNQEHTSGAAQVPKASGVTKESSGTTSGIILADHALPTNLFILPLESTAIFPTLMAPVMVNEPRFVNTIEEALNRQKIIGLLMTKEEATKGGGAKENIKSEELEQMGVAVKILKRIRMPDGGVNVLIQGMKRFKIKQVLAERPHLVVEATYLEDKIEKSKELDALTRMVFAHVKKLSENSPFFTDEMKLAMLNAPGASAIADIVAFALALPKSESQDFLQTISVKERFEKLLVHLKREQDLSELQKKIQNEVNAKMNQMQRDFFLKEQLKIVKKELGHAEEGKEKTLDTLREKIEALQLPPEIKTIATEELSKLSSVTEYSPEYQVVRNYLETLCALPWNESTSDKLELQHARTILEQDHFGLEKVKTRIIEFLAVRKRLQAQGIKNNEKTPKVKASILCLVGPPGVGKTSIARSIADSMGRKFFRFSLGGMRDEAEIKGHRRTYIGAMPGKVISSLKRVGTKNPVLLLDEIDKLSFSHHGDPASALLEVLDPEQNHAFLDHYLDVPFDLSQVFFIATANSVNGIPEPLLDRMEVIEIPGYTLEEKEKITRKYIIPKVLKASGVSEKNIFFSKETLHTLMLDYAREPGMRSAERMIENIARKVATQLVNEEENKKSNQKSNNKTPRVTIDSKKLRVWLGPQRFFNETSEKNTTPGVVTGLAWTAMGGDILFIEATQVPGTGQLKFTGNMGDVMSESATIAATYVKKKLSLTRKSKLAQEQALEAFKKMDIHLHIPAGAIPKDGPSAGVTMATALYSMSTGKVVRPSLAMTGELSLVGKVLPVGGIKEKLLAAKRAGIKEVILPMRNKKDLQEISKEMTKGLKISFASKIEDVFKRAF